MNRLCVVLPVFVGLLCIAFPSYAADEGSPLQTTGDPFMGDWQGTWGDRTVCAQVIALGNGEYTANLLAQFDTRERPLAVLKGTRTDDAVSFEGLRNETRWNGRIESDVFAGSTEGVKSGAFELKRVVRHSPTLGAKPPEGAVVLFDGTSLDGWVHPTPDPRVTNLDGIMGGENRVAYLRTQVWSPNAQRMRLEMGSDDGIKAWFNGELVHTNNVMRGPAPGQDAVEVSVTKGWNTLLLKITQGGGGSGACAQFATIDGKAETGLFALRDQGMQAVNNPKSGVSLDENGGAILDWQVAGPYYKEGVDASKLFDVSFVPEEGGAADWTWLLHEAKVHEKCRWKLLDTGAMEVSSGGIVSVHPFKDHKLHLEFRTPFMPEARGQSRGNSGVYLQGRYEVQILDSYGLTGEWNECGGIYQVSKPRVNMAAPPLQWQTYDITYYAPRFDAAGRKIKDATITVLHNGVTIHEDVAIPDPTTAHIGGDIRVAQGVHLQDHGNPVQFRNIWAVELD